MSRELERVYLNHIWRIEAKTPSYTRAGLKDSFRSIDNSRIEPDQTSGLTRAFMVDFSKRGQYEPLVSSSIRYSTNSFQVYLYYDFDTYTNYILNSIICNDINDITRTLDNHAQWIGYDTTNTTTDIGLKNRIVTSVVKEIEGRLVIVTFETNCLVREDS